jgi:hypothetical protein
LIVNAVPNGQLITATATNQNNTSEFSICQAVTSSAAPFNQPAVHGLSVAPVSLQAPKATFQSAAAIQPQLELAAHFARVTPTESPSAEPWATIPQDPDKLASPHPQLLPADYLANVFGELDDSAPALALS